MLDIDQGASYLKKGPLSSEGAQDASSNTWQEAKSCGARVYGVVVGFSTFCRQMLTTVSHEDCVDLVWEWSDSIL